MMLNSPSQIHSLLDAQRFLNYGTGPGGAFGAAPNYVRTAFISSTGNDGTAVLNDPNFPFNNLSAVASALYAAYVGLPTTIRLLDNITSEIGLGVQGLLQHGLTIRSHDATLRTLTGTINLYGDTNAGTSDLSLVNVHVTAITDTHNNSSAESAGILRGDATSVVGTLTLSGSVVPDDGTPGTNGVDSSGNDGADGVDGDPPGDGGVGENALSDGTPGENGLPGNAAWNLTIYAESGFLIEEIVATGSAGTAGGNGGNGGVAAAGDGGNGGASTGTDQDGGNGANGGDATSNGGLGGDGGAGGNGSTITVIGNVTVTTANYSGGAGGDKGLGGAPGTATAGAAGLGGSPSGSGNPGSNGSSGMNSASSGTDGINGSVGQNGGLV